MKLLSRKTLVYDGKRALGGQRVSLEVKLGEAGPFKRGADFLGAGVGNLVVAELSSLQRAQTTTEKRCCAAVAQFAAREVEVLQTAVMREERLDQHVYTLCAGPVAIL
jgi:hypothetical protein